VQGTLVTEGVRGDGGILKNNLGKRFMFNYIPARFAAETADTEAEAEQWMQGVEGARRPPELLTRDVVARAIRAEVQAGRGSPRGGAYLDIASRQPAEFIRRKLPSMYHQFKELAEVDITAEPMEVGPTLHYFMGGVRVDADTQQTRVQGLFACGECAAGLHGANRLGGNSLSDLIVFGKLAGDGAADYVRGLDKTPRADDDQIKAAFREATAPLNRESGENPYVLQDELQDCMGEYVGIVRNEADLERGIERIGELKARAKNVKAHGASQYNPGWHQALSIDSLLKMSEAIAQAAKMRQESRGAHTREDYEGERDEWLEYNIVVRKGAGGELEIEKVKRPEPPEHLARIANATIEDLESGKVGGEKD
jgi:succinate dehydrogenase / fumarate reductase flavoprotein subunit